MFFSCEKYKEKIRLEDISVPAAIGRRIFMKNNSIIKELLKFSLPLILSGVLQQLYNWADAFILGHSGVDGELMLGAVGATSTITQLLINTMLGFTVGLSIMAAQEYGRKNMDTIRQIVKVFLPILCAVYTVLTLILIFFHRLRLEL